MPRKSEGSASAPVSRATAIPTASSSLSTRKSARATGAAKKRVRYASASDEEHCAEGDEEVMLDEDGEDGEETTTPVAQPKKTSKAGQPHPSSHIKRATDAYMREDAKEKTADAAEYAAKLKSAIVAGQVAADKLVDASKLKLEQKMERVGFGRIPRFTLVGQPEQYREVALRLDDYARRLATSLQKYNLKLLDPEQDLHETIGHVFAARIERTRHEQHKLDKVIKETAAEHYAAAQSADESYREMRKYLKRTARS